jgi:type VI secretion system secreted protein Hcp
MMMKMDGVTGDSKSFKHKGWADIISWNWGMTSNRKSAQGNGEEKTSMNELSIIKAIGNDSSSIRLLFAESKTISSVEFSISPVVGKREPQKNYVNISMEGVIIKSIVTGGGTDEDFFREHITLLFDRVKFEYNRTTQTNEDGSLVTGPEIDFDWDISGNKIWEH